MPDAKDVLRRMVGELTSDSAWPSDATWNDARAVLGMSALAPATGGKAVGVLAAVISPPRTFVLPSPPKLTPALRAMLERIASATDRSGSLMVLTITASGGREPGKLNKLIQAGWAEDCDHVLRRGAVDGVRVTEAGRSALRGGKD